MDYGFPEKRKSRNDKRAKARFNKYKKGGAMRIAGMQMTNKRES